MDEDGLEPVQMEVDEEAYPLDNITTYDSHLDLKPPEKKIQAKGKKINEAPSKPEIPIIKKIHHGDDVKEMFCYYIYEKGMAAKKAASIMNISRRTGYNWLKDDPQNVLDRLEGKKDDSRDEELTERRGRKAILNEDHKKHLEETFGENPSATVDQAINSLTSHFEGLKVSKKTVHNFMVNECALSFKKAYFYPAERNSTEKIQQIPSLSLSLEVPSTTKLHRLSHRDVIVTSTDSLTADKATQEDKMMLARLGRWTPVVYNHNNMQYGLLTSLSIASILLSKNQTIATWCSPTNNDKHSSKEVMAIDTDHFVQHLKITSFEKTGGYSHEEITGEMTDLLNRDWLQYPQMRYCTSQLLVGAILIEGSAAIVINALEPYSRDTLFDAHHERRLFGVATSFPSKTNRYGFLLI